MSDITAQLIEQVQSAYGSAAPISIQGGGSKQFLGREISGEPLRVAENRGIISYHPTELVMTARCGTPIEEINRTLAEYGQQCQFESPSFNGQATVGGTLACNLSGPARPWQGSIRDAVLGVRLINGRGEDLKFGGQVMKNVAGYDVSRLQAGAFGTLGVITEVSFKVMPAPAATTTLVIAMDVTEAIGQMNRLSGRPLPITGSCWLDDALYLRLAGASRAVECSAAELGGESMEEGAAANFWQGVGEQRLDYFQGDLPLWRFSLNSNAPIPSLEEEWLIDWGGAQRWIRGHFERRHLEAIAEEARGQLTLYRHGDRSGECFHTPSAIQQRLQKNLKDSFDPKGVLNPGRLYGWL